MLNFMINRNMFKSNNSYRINGIGKVRIDNRDFTQGVPISNTMELKMHMNDNIREIKYRFKHLVK